jgi:hypothetical protein
VEAHVDLGPGEILGLIASGGTLVTVVVTAIVRDRFLPKVKKELSESLDEKLTHCQEASDNKIKLFDKQAGSNVKRLQTALEEYEKAADKRMENIEDGLEKVSAGLGDVHKIIGEVDVRAQERHEKMMWYLQEGKA